MDRYVHPKFPVFQVAKPIAKNLAAKAKDSRIFRHEIIINGKG
jgi:hypothetical protein